MRINRIFKKRILAICILFTSSILVIDIYTRSRSDNNNSSNVIISNHHRKEAVENEQKNAIPIMDPNTWVFNPPISQFSPKAIINPNRNELILEIFGFCEYSNQSPNSLRSNTRFVVYVNSSTSPLYFDVSEVFPIHTNMKKGTRSYWQIRLVLKLDKFRYLLNNLAFAVVDFKTTEKLFTDFGSHSDAMYLISYHRPNVYDISKISVKKEVAHCVHMVRDIESERRIRMLNWLEIQKRIGYNKIKLYLYQVSKETEIKMIEQAEKIGLEIDLVDYRFDYEFLCKHQLDLFNANNKSAVLRNRLDACRDFTAVYFNPKKDEVVNSHEIACANDCLTNYKYQYEFMTNYDFDEILFPRMIKNNDYSLTRNQGDCNSLSTHFDYNIYNYSCELVKKHGRDVCSFHFEHVLFLDNFDETFLDKVFSGEKRVDYRYYKNGAKITFSISDSNHNKIEFLRKNQDLGRCLHDKIKKTGKFDDLWNSAYAVNFNNRLGKSLFVSNATQVYTQHRISRIIGDYRELRVPLEDGFSSHFRERIEGFFSNNKFHFHQFIFDLEYYHFLAFF